MPLPDLIAIEPPVGTPAGEVSVPGSKSITNRALVLAALGEGETVLRGALWSEDTQVMVDCLRDLGVMVNVDADRDESANRTITVYGTAGQVPRGGTVEQPLDLFVGNAGTAARFLAAMLCLGQGVYRLSGVPRMHERPQGALFEALRQLGYRVESPNQRLPVLIYGGGARPGTCRVHIGESSQFASALLLSAHIGGWKVEVEGEDAEESPYVHMTTELIRSFAGRGKELQIEPDASSGSYFWAAGALLAGPGKASAVRVRHWPSSGWQIDAAFPRFLPLPAQVSRRDHLGDSILTAMILAPFATAPTLFTDLGRLRVQECERVVAMRTELVKCGAEVVEAGDTLRITPGPLHGAEIETYGDHRMAMCFAVLGLKVPGIKLKNPACVKKTFPNFFQKWAAAAPSGLGVVMRDARTGAVLDGDSLFAD